MFSSCCAVVLLPILAFLLCFIGFFRCIPNISVNMDSMQLVWCVCRLLFLLLLHFDFSTLPVHAEVTLATTTSKETCHSNNKDCNFHKESNLNAELVQLEGIKVGHYQDVELVDGQLHRVITRSLRPLLFEIGHFLTDEECDRIIDLAKTEGLTESKNIDVNDPEDAEDEKTELEEQCGKMMADFDSDKNGQISALELSTFFQTTSSIMLKETDTKTMLRELNFDQNGDGELSHQECLKVNVSALDNFLANPGDKNPHYRPRVSQQAWLSTDKQSDPVLIRLQNRLVTLTKLPWQIVEESENLQVVRYSVSGHFHTHYDSSALRDKPCCSSSGFSAGESCSICRFATILYYLSNVTGGGETAFPIADNSTFDEKLFENKGMYNLSANCHLSNIVVRPRKGTAILWYNHHIDANSGLMGCMDEYSLHGGCDVLEGVKWIANNWINARPR